MAFDYFRGIAILFIVAGHSYGPWVIDSFGERVLANLISGGTTLFVFISGFFFHYIYYEKFNSKEFLKKKTKHVFIPYFVLSLTGIGYYVFSLNPLPLADQLGITRLESWTQYIEIVAIYLWTGKIAIAYWYIPFILIIFVISPLFTRYIRLSTAYRNIIFLLFLITSMFIHRPVGNLSQVHSVLYFMPIYMLGIICSIHREYVLEFIKDKSIILGVTVLFLSALQVLLYKGYGNFHKEEIFSYGGLDIIIIQKIAMCFFFLSILQKYESRNIPALKVLASSSFAIFFIHPWILKVFSETGVWSFLQFLPEIGIFIVTVPLALISSLLVASIIKLGLKANSRYVIGW
ncbi:MAG: acyltransferase [Proteobacteria bacterium]|nr:acyltransferase [Pseudomonadota bacterium]